MKASALFISYSSLRSSAPKLFRTHEDLQRLLHRQIPKFAQHDTKSSNGA